MYALGHAINGRQLFRNFNPKRIKTSNKEIKKIVKSLHKEYLASKIFTDALQMVMDDIIDNSVTFEINLNKKQLGQIYIKEVSGEDFINEFKNGRHKYIDYLETNFTGYNPVFKYSKAGYTVEKPVYLDKTRQQRIAARANSGKSYY